MGARRATTPGWSGTPDAVVEQITALAEAGLDRIMLQHHLHRTTTRLRADRRARCSRRVCSRSARLRTDYVAGLGGLVLCCACSPVVRARRRHRRRLALARGHRHLAAAHRAAGDRRSRSSRPRKDDARAARRLRRADRRGRDRRDLLILDRCSSRQGASGRPRVGRLSLGRRGRRSRPSRAAWWAMRNQAAPGPADRRRRFEPCRRRRRPTPRRPPPRLAADAEP